MTDATAARYVGRFFEDMVIGEAAESHHRITEEDIIAFARISGDYNPLHMDEEYARGTLFGGRIAHGALTASYISALLGNTLPGPGAIFSGLELKFKRPVRIGDDVTARAEVIEKSDRGNRVTMRVSCSVGGKPVVTGTAQVVAPSRPVA